MLKKFHHFFNVSRITRNIKEYICVKNFLIQTYTSPKMIKL